jgi:hypothetical protein
MGTEKIKRSFRDRCEAAAKNEEAYEAARTRAAKAVSRCGRSHDEGLVLCEDSVAHVMSEEILAAEARGRAESEKKIYNLEKSLDFYRDIARHSCGE